MCRTMPLILIPVLALGPGCSKELTPAQICSKLEKLESKVKPEPGEKKKPQAELKKEYAQCLKDLRRLKKKNTKAYRCIAGCTKHSTHDEAMACTVACAFKHTSKKESKKIEKEARAGDRRPVQ